MGEAKRVYQARHGIRRTLITDEATPDDVTVLTEMDVEPVLDSIHRDRELMPQTGHNKLMARIPTVIYEELQRKGIADDPDRFKAWLNGPEAAPWRVWRGTV